MQKSTVRKERLSASPATAFRKPEQSRLETLKRCLEELRHTTAIQLCYDGKILSKLDRWVLLDQFVSEKKSLKIYCCENLFGRNICDF